MKKFTLAVVALAAFVSGASAQFVKKNSGVTADLKAVYFTDTLNGVVVGGGQTQSGSVPGIILHTTDGGETWTKVYEKTGDRPYGVVFVSKDSGYVFGDNTGIPIIKVTGDGGATWSNFTGTLPKGGSFQSAVFKNGKGHMIGIGLKATSYLSTDNGHSWNPQGIDSTLFLYDIGFGDADKGYACGDDLLTGYPLVMITKNGGNNWYGGYIPYQGSFHAISAPDTATCYVGGTAINIPAVMRTLDGGKSWRFCFNGLPINGTVTDLWFENDSVGFASVTGPQNGIYWVHTPGAPGKQWVDFFLFPNNGAPTAMYFIDEQHAWVVGQTGLIYKKGKNPASINKPDFNIGELSVFPNPAANSCYVAFTLNQQQQVSLAFYDAEGRLVKPLNQSEMMSAGDHQFEVSLAGIPSGIYFVKLTAGLDGTGTIRLVKTTE